MQCNDQATFAGNSILHKMFSPDMSKSVAVLKCLMIKQEITHVRNIFSPDRPM